MRLLKLLQPTEIWWRWSLLTVCLFLWKCRYATTLWQRVFYHPHVGVQAAVYILLDMREFKKPWAKMAQYCFIRRCDSFLCLKHACYGWICNKFRFFLDYRPIFPCSFAEENGDARKGTSSRNGPVYLKNNRWKFDWLDRSDGVHLQCRWPPNVKDLPPKELRSSEHAFWSCSTYRNLMTMELVDGMTFC